MISVPARSPPPRSYTIPSKSTKFPFEAIKLSVKGVTAADPHGSIATYYYGIVNVDSGAETVLATSASSMYVFSALGVGTFQLFFVAVDNYGASLKVRLGTHSSS